MISLNLFPTEKPKQQKTQRPKQQKQSDKETQQCSTSASSSSQQRKLPKPKTPNEDINDLFSVESYTAASEYQVEEAVSPNQDNEGKKTGKYFF